MEPRDSAKVQFGLDAFDSINPSKLAWREGGGVEIVFSDGHRGLFDRPYLRAMCPCATCSGTHGPPTTLVDARAIAQPEPKPGRKGSFSISAGPRPPSVETSLQLAGAEPVGSYGMKLRWGDGHDTGIFSWSYLRAVSPGDGTEAHPPAPGAQLVARPQAKKALAERDA